MSEYKKIYTGKPSQWGLPVGTYVKCISRGRYGKILKLVNHEVENVLGVGEIDILNPLISLGLNYIALPAYNTKLGKLVYG